MGADGHVMYIERETFDESEYSDLDPAKIGWYPRRVLWHDILWTYWDTERDNDTWGNPSQYSRDFAAAKYRSRPDREPSSPTLVRMGYDYASGHLKSDLDYIAKCEATAGHEERLALGERYTSLTIWLDAVAEDWEVWT